MSEFFKQYAKKELKPLDEVDIKILYYVWLGISQCTHIAQFLDAPKQTISQKAIKLENMGYIQIEDTQARSFYRKYKLTKTSYKLIKDITPTKADFNLLLLYYRKQK